MSTQQDLAALTADCSYNAAAKANFHKVAKKYLRRLVTELALPKGHFEIRSNQGGIAVSGEAILHGERLYLWVSQSCLGRNHVVWYRGCHGMKDYTGMASHTADAATFVDTPLMAKLCRTVIAMAEMTGGVKPARAA